MKILKLLTRCLLTEPQLSCQFNPCLKVRPLSNHPDIEAERITRRTFTWQRLCPLLIFEMKGNVLALRSSRLTLLSKQTNQKQNKCLSQIHWGVSNKPRWWDKLKIVQTWFNLRWNVLRCALKTKESKIIRSWSKTRRASFTSLWWENNLNGRS